MVAKYDIFTIKNIDLLSCCSSKILFGGGTPNVYELYILYRQRNLKKKKYN